MSSLVAHGPVGLSASAPVLQALGHTVIGLPTVILSNHPGWTRVAGERVSPETLTAMLDALEGNGWLQGVAAVLTGYLPSPGHVAVAAEALARIRAQSPGVRIVVDPVMGDAPKGLYIARDAAEALRDRLVPLAEILTPNAFELGWLTGEEVTDSAALARAACALRAGSGIASVVVTSVPVSASETGVLDFCGEASELYTVPRHETVPHGVGDVFGALLAAGQATGAALGALQALIADSVGADHLRIAETTAWRSARPIEPS